MKIPLTVGAFLAFSQAARADERCSTQYGTTSTTSVPTYMTTATSTFSSYTVIDLSSTSTTTSTVSFTFISVKGNHTTTIPTGPSFTPAVNAPRENGAKRNIRPGDPHPNVNPFGNVPMVILTLKMKTTTSKATSTLFPHQVNCTTTVDTTQISTSTFYYIETEIATKSFTSTLYVATSTAYAACKNNNVISRIQNQRITSWSTLALRDLCTPGYGTTGGIACANARSCCEAAQAQQADGFVYFNASNVQCNLLVEWGFNTGGHFEYPLHVGNGPSGSGYYGPP